MRGLREAWMGAPSRFTKARARTRAPLALALARSPFSSPSLDVERSTSISPEKTSLNDRQRALNLGQRLGITPLDYDSWYNVSNKDIVKSKGSGLLRKFRNSPSRLVEAAFPEHSWDLSRFRSKPRHFWESQENRKRFLIELGTKLGIKEGDFEGWTKVGWKDFRRYGAATLLSEFDDSAAKMLASVFPEHKWDPNGFQKKPKNYWGDKRNHRTVFMEVGLKLGIKEANLDLWYKVKAEDLRSNGGDVLLKQYRNSISEMILQVRPEHSWDLGKFHVKPRRYFASKETQREFVLSMARSLGVKEGNFEGFYSIKTTDFAKFGGWSLLDLYSRSPRIAITALFPEHAWLPWRFDVQATKWFWEDPEALRLAATFIETKLDIKDLDGWYRVSSSQIKDLGLSSYLKNVRLLERLLRSLYPNHLWEPPKFTLFRSTRPKESL